jgi:hypothetical protein
MALILWCYGASNSAVVNLGGLAGRRRPSWRPACVMVAVMSVGMGLSIVANSQATGTGELHSHGPESGGD